MSQRIFEAGEKSMSRGFFPFRYLRWHDERRVTRNLLRTDDPTVQEYSFYNEAKRGHRYLDAGETRQTQPAPWSARRRATHFVALRVPPQSTLFASISALHTDVRDSFSASQWMSAFTPLPRLHLTLSVMTLDGEENPAASPSSASTSFNKEQLDAVTRICGEAFARWGQQTGGRGFTLRSNTLGFFDEGRVAFARLSQDYDMPLLQRCVKDLRLELASKAGVDIKGNKHDEFVPHVTIAKVTGRLSREKFGGAKRLPRSIFTHMAWDDLGAAQFTSAGLCCMRPVAASTNSNVATAEEAGNSEAGKTGDESEFPDGGSAAAAEPKTAAAAAATTTTTGDDYWDQLVASNLSKSSRSSQPQQ